ncbi:hypothetical protein ACH47C_13955 [Streptomyces rishiriensis]|uniref:hypothetical protein n=1 Tax=Streptomyces rishiriensis TaxID=68264 RepID=UPI0033C41F4F
MPPDGSGEWGVHVDDEILGRTHGLRDLAQAPRGAGIEDVDEDYAATSGLIEWPSGGLETWE